MGAAPVPRLDPSKDIPTALKKIRRQMAVNLSYFDRDAADLLLGLQDHIEVQLKEIELHSGLPVTPYSKGAAQ